MTGATLFTGFGGADIGMKAAGLEMRWGIELEDDIAAVARSNHFTVRTADVTDVHPDDRDQVDALHLSPPCPSFSIAKARRGESKRDIHMALATVRFICALRPRIVTIENVWGYRKSYSWRIIWKELHRLGYGIGYALMNAADYGVPQTRERMLVWAMADGRTLPAPTPTHAKDPPPPGLFGDVLPKWIGWFEAIADLVDDLPESELADWQVDRLPQEIRTMLIDGQGTIPSKNGTREDRRLQTIPKDQPANAVNASQHKGIGRAILMQNGNEYSPVAEIDRPSPTVVGATGGISRPRAVLVGQNANATSGVAIEREEGEPSLAIRTGRNHVPKVVMGARVVALTPRCLARFQTFPDSYTLPESRELACRGIGNAVPAVLIQRLYEHLINQL